MVIFQNIGGAIEPNRFKTKLSNFNSTNFGSKAIQVQDLLFGPRNKIFILRAFTNKADALAYNTTLYDNDDVYGSVSTDEYHQYVISANNLATLISQAKIEEYEDFTETFTVSFVRVNQGIIFLYLYMPSSVIKTYHYDPETKELKIVFVSGLIYKYREVPEEIFLRMKGYTSKGAFLNKFIKRNFVFERID